MKTLKQLAAGGSEAADFIKASTGFAIAKMFSINLFDFNLKVTVVIGDKVEIILPFDGNSELEYVMLRYNDDKTITVIPTAFVDGKITFRTNHFSSNAEKPTIVPLTGILLLGRLM